MQIYLYTYFLQVELTFNSISKGFCMFDFEYIVTLFGILYVFGVVFLQHS